MCKIAKFILSVILLGMSTEASAKVYLVSAGVSDYPGTEMDLTLSAKDAKTITWLYSQNGDVEYCELVNRHATCANIVRAMNTIFAKADADDTVVLFFSGHGYPGGIVGHDGTLSYDYVRRAMANSDAKNKMVFVDACYSGKMQTPGKSDGTDLASLEQANVMLFLSSRKNETSIEYLYMDNSVFTNFLVKGLRGGADVNANRTITARELFNYVSSGVIQASDGKQHPTMWGKFSDNMPVMKWKK